MNILNIEKTCRLCLTRTTVSFSLFRDNGAKILESLTCIKVSETDELPKSACVKCWLNMKLAYHIQQNILEVDKRLQLIEFVKDESTGETEHDDDFDTIENNSFPLEYSKEYLNLMVCNQELLKTEGDDFEIDNDEDVQIYRFENVPEEDIGNEDKQETCLICGTQETCISEHIKQHYLNTQTCEECGCNFDSIRTYRFHILSEHGDISNQWTCDVCQLTFQYKSLYNVHKEKAHLVQQENNSKEKANRNDDLIENRDVKLFQCFECSKTFTDKNSYATHERCHERKKCPICNVSITRNNLKKHLVTHNSESVICHLCGATCKNSDSLRGHLFYTHSTRSYICEYCGKVFKKRYSRMLHVKKSHTGEKNHICETCGKSFYTKYTLSTHIKLKHLEIQLYTCGYCKKNFSSRYALRTHERQHNNETPYKCNLCPEKFRQNISLRTHKKSKHNIIEEKNVECKVCNRKFGSLWAVKCHMRLHLGS